MNISTYIYFLIKICYKSVCSYAKEELERLYGIKVLAVQADVSAGADNEAVVGNVVKQTIDEFGRIDVLINNAKVLKLCGPCKRTDNININPIFAPLCSSYSCKTTDTFLL